MKSKAIVVAFVTLLAAGAAFVWLRQSSEEAPGEKEEFSEAEILEQDEISQQPVIDEELIELIETSDMSDPAIREQVAEQVKAREDAIRAATHARAERLGIPIREEFPDGQIIEIQGFEGDRPVYYSTHNVNAAISSGASQVRNKAPYNLSGSGVNVGVWDGGVALGSHQEFSDGDVEIIDKKAAAHPTHVIGTITAKGADAKALGMAPSSQVKSYDWDSDVSEMIMAGASSGKEKAKVSISNHSYGMRSGYGVSNNSWAWFGEPVLPGTSGQIEERFGQYDSHSRSVDTVAFSVPYLTSFYSAGNDRSNVPEWGNRVRQWREDSFVFDPDTSPKGDGKYRNGFENINGANLGKNVITVGAANDAVAGGGRSPAGATMSDFSSWGPTDDGRIKPDLVANGVQVYSPISRFNTSYDSWDGTSMSSPSAAGSAALLAELYRKNFEFTLGTALMPSSMMKALLIHSADDIGKTGPDYTNGWGLINVKAAADIILDHKKSFDWRTPRVGRKLIEGSIQADKKPFTHVFQSDGTSPIRVTLCWTDPAGPEQGSDSRTSVLSHNLDLVITGPNGEIHRPFKMPYVKNWSLAKLSAEATRGKNDTDNVEQIFDKAKPTLNGAGIYKVTVSLDGSLKKGIAKQDFSLVVTGGQALPSGGAVIDLNSSLNFGKVADNRSRTLHLEIRNVGYEDLIVTGIDYGGNMDLAGGYSGTIRPGEVAVAPVRYAPISYMSSAVPASVKWFGTLRVLSTATAGRSTVPLGRFVAGEKNDAPQLKLPEPGVNVRTNYIDNIVGSEWSFDLVPNDWSEEKAVPFSNRFAFNKDWTVRIIVVDNPNYRTSDIKAGFEWMPIGPNQVKVYNPKGFPGYQEGIILKFTSEKKFETTNLVGQAIIGRRYGEPGPKVDFTKDLSGMVMQYIHHLKKGNTINDFSTGYDQVFAVLQAGGGMKSFLRDDNHGLWDNVTWKTYGDNVVRLYNGSTSQEMYLHLVSPKFTGYKAYVSVGWSGNNVTGSLVEAWKDKTRITDLTERHESNISGNFGGIEMEWRLPGQDEGESKGYWRAYSKTTQKQWNSIMPTNPSSRIGNNLPVDRLPWKDVREWVEKMNAKYPLPAGNQWATQPRYTFRVKAEAIASGFKATIVSSGN